MIGVKSITFEAFYHTIGQGTVWTQNVYSVLIKSSNREKRSLFFFFLAASFIVSIWSKAWDWARGWLKGFPVDAGRSSGRTWGIQRGPSKASGLQSSWLSLTVSLLEDRLAQPSVGVGAEVSQVSPILMRFTFSTRKWFSRKLQRCAHTDETQGVQIQRARLGFFSRTLGPGVYPITLGQLLHALEKGIPVARVLYFQELQDALQLPSEAVTHARLSHLPAWPAGTA